MHPTPSSKQWPQSDVIVLSDETNLSMILRELLKPLEWRIAQTTENPAAAIDLLEQGQAHCFIVIDSPSHAAAEHLRSLYKNATARLTPTLVLASENLRHDLLVYEKIFRTHVAPKPLTPNTFIPAFKQMLRTWEIPAMAALRKLSPLLMDAKIFAKIEILRKLRADPVALPLALQAESAVLLSQSKATEAELQLLETFKKFPSHPNLMAQLAWFYLNVKMPDQSIRYLRKLQSMAMPSTIFNLDLAAAHLAKNELEEALPFLIAWKNTHPTNTLIDGQIARILVTQDQTDLADSFGVAKGMVRKTQDLWDQIDHSGHPPPSGTNIKEPGPRAS
jgi:hypothetical protein